MSDSLEREITDEYEATKWQEDSVTAVALEHVAADPDLAPKTRDVAKKALDLITAGKATSLEDAIAPDEDMARKFSGGFPRASGDRPWMPASMAA